MFKKILLLLVVLTANLKAVDLSNTEELDKRVWDLINQFTIDEKIQTLSSGIWDGIPRLNIPDYQWHNESEHGLCIENVTVFPQSINLSATWNLDLMHRVANAISDEARVKFRHGEVGLNFWSPSINIARDPRWGRVQETYGEDPYLASRMSVAYINGMQGDNPKYFKTIASPKHYVVHSGPESKRHHFDAIVGERDLWETYMPAFKSSIMEAGAFSIMAAFNAVNGRPVVTNPYLIQDVLRRQWDFKGFVVTDCNAIGDSFWEHKVGSNEREGTALALLTGIDSECGDFYKDHLKKAYLEGYVTEEDINISVFRLYRAKFLLGLYDDPELVEYTKIPDSVVDSDEHNSIALETAKESIVLLKNDGTLPLSKELERILVVGPNANVFYENLGSYTGWPSKPVTILEGIKKTVSESTDIVFRKETEVGGTLTELVTPKNVRTHDGQPGFKGEYFANRFMLGEPTAIRIDTVLDFNWGYIDPIEGVSADSFSVRWTGIIRVDEPGEYTIKVTSDDGTRIRIGDKVVIDDYTPHGTITRIGFFEFEANKDYDILIEYLQWWAPGDIKFEIGNKKSGSKQMAELKDFAKDFDAVIYVGGLSSDYENEQSFLETEGFYQGDRTSLDLPWGQLKIIEALHSSGKPVVMVNLGTTLALNWHHANINSILHTWYLGQTAGDAVGAVLFGDYNPAGRTPVTFHNSVDELPHFDNYDMAGRTYRYFEGKPLYEFGYGLSYTDFEYSDMTLPFGEIKLCESDTAVITYKISNTGRYDGDEVVQLYVKYLDSRLSQPIKQLKQFKRLHLKAGETRVDTLYLNLNELYSYDPAKKRYIRENGNYELQLGSSSLDIRQIGNIEIDNCGVENTSVIADFSLNIYPNPTSGYLNISSELPLSENYDIEIFDILGNKQNVILDSDFLSNIARIDCSNLNTGIYSLVIRSKSEIIRRKFAIVK
ncbi:MAG: glycoside hydrolase family 3 C-terminal domain-containing protein [Candidatus Kapabacteria bacterium]|nr:glycoside hydrolase family 3 C-terminal domain-containing protein [Ignavibacteriota bacterium]MCW5886235.1 glycoside hydrolase family 3 C-terminal domain-containing protein [Candidatus Kapabacteria bacterium]